MAQFRAQSETARRTFAQVPAAQDLLLYGRVVTMNAARQVIDDGVVGISGNTIVHVAERAAPLPPQMTGAVKVETGGTIYPGLIELHNHPAYNAVPLWDPPKMYGNRSEWRDHSLEYVRRVKNPAALTGKNKLDPDYPRAIARFVECKALLGAQTTFAGLAASDNRNYPGLVRNVEFPNEPGWPVAEGWINDFKNKEDAEQKITPVLGDMSHPKILHLSEGTDAAARQVFTYLQKKDGTWLLAPNILTIHAVGLDTTDFDVLAASGGLVWSPLSNLLLYGQTAKVTAAKKAGVRLALGSDWAPSGSKNPLSELKIARVVSAHEGGLFSDEDLVAMVTSTPAAMLGWDPWLGSIATNLRADLAIVAGTSKDPYAQLIEATEEEVLAVLINGRPRCGRSDLLDPLSPAIEKFDVGASTFLIDLSEPGSDPLAGMKLSDAITKLTYGFGHLPELARDRNRHPAPLLTLTESMTLRLEMDEPALDGMRIFAEPVILPSEVDRMAIEPLTAVDDAGFIPRLQAARNLPDWVKAAL